MNIIFRLDNSTSGCKIIKLVYRFAGEKFVYSTKEKIKPEYWDRETQRPISSDKFPKPIITQNKITKNILDRYEAKLVEIIGEVKRAGAKLTKDYLQSEMDKQLKFKENSESIITKGKINDFYELIKIFIDDSESGKRTTRGGIKISKGRIKHYKSIITILKKFREKINVDDIHLEFYNEFIAFRNKEITIRKDEEIITGKSLNTIGSNINIIKAVLTYTYKIKLHNNRIFEEDDFKGFAEDRENVYISDSELDILWEKDFGARLNNVRDVFLIGCYTGLRISDLSQLNKNNFVNNDSLLKVITEKTKEIVFIPIHWRIHEIIERNNGLPKSISDQRTNEYLKELCQKAEFTEKSYYKKTIGGNVEKFVQEKYERVTNHTARRSFATNMYLAGFDVLSIMKITGHQSERTFMKYICLSQRQMAEKMVTHPYFIKPI